MPYPVAHPAAVLPLVRPLGPLAVPSALAIGSVVPDLWYFVPLVSRAESHGIPALLWFCLPVGAALYLLFHLVLKQPLIALISPRLGAFACRGVPPAPWYAVATSLVIGALTHIAWDLVTHAAGGNWLQHASTALGAGVLAWWIAGKLRRARLPVEAPRLSTLSRAGVVLGLAAAMALAALSSAETAFALDRATLRHLLRSAGIAGAEGFAAASFAYCVLWQLYPWRGKRRAKN